MSDTHGHVVCPYCGTHLDGNLTTTGDYRPDPGDLVICVACHRVAVTTSTGPLRPVTRAEAAGLNERDDVRAALDALRNADEDDEDDEEESTG